MREAECPNCGGTEWYVYYKTTEVQNISTSGGYISYNGSTDVYESGSNHGYECAQCGLDLHIDPPSDEYEDLLAAIDAHPLSQPISDYESDLLTTGVL